MDDSYRFLATDLSTLRANALLLERDNLTSTQVRNYGTALAKARRLVVSDCATL
jgi:hypothetical protein